MKPPSLQEQEIKAGLLYNFLKYTDWPPANLARRLFTMTVCIFGDDPLNDGIFAADGRAHGQPKA